MIHTIHTSRSSMYPNFLPCFARATSLQAARRVTASAGTKVAAGVETAKLVASVGGGGIAKEEAKKNRKKDNPDTGESADVELETPDGKKIKAIPKVEAPDPLGRGSAKNLRNFNLAGWLDDNPIQLGLSRVMCDLYCTEEAVKVSTESILENLRVSTNTLQVNFERHSPGITQSTRTSLHHRFLNWCFHLFHFEFFKPKPRGKIRRHCGSSDGVGVVFCCSFFDGDHTCRWNPKGSKQCLELVSLVSSGLLDYQSQLIFYGLGQLRDQLQPTESEARALVQMDPGSGSTLDVEKMLVELQEWTGGTGGTGGKVGKDAKGPIASDWIGLITLDKRIVMNIKSMHGGRSQFIMIHQASKNTVIYHLRTGCDWFQDVRAYNF